MKKIDILDTNGKRISFGLINDDRITIYDLNRNQISYGHFITADRINIFDLQGNQISFARKIDNRFSIFDLKSVLIGFGDIK